MSRLLLGGLVRVEADGASGKACDIEVALFQHALETQHRAQAVRARRRGEGAGVGFRRRAVRHGFRHHPSEQLAFRGRLQVHEAGNGHADVGVAHWQRVDITRLEVRSDRRHEVLGVGTGEVAVHALALLQAGVGDFHGAEHRLVAACRIGAEVHHDGGMRRQRLAVEADRGEAERAADRRQFVIDEDAADIVLRQQRIDHAPRQLAVVLGEIDQVGSAVGCDDDLRLGGILADQAVAEARIGVCGSHCGVLAVGIEQRQVERLGEIEREEPGRQRAFLDVGIFALRRRAGRTLLRDGREAMVGRDDDVGRILQAEILQRLAHLAEIVVGILDRRERGRAVDAGRHAVEAVALVVLRAIRIARP